MLNHLPNLQPGTKLIVWHCANGATEYICRPDDPIAASMFDGPFGRLMMTLAFVAVVVYLFTLLTAEPHAQPLPSETANTEAVREGW